MDLQPAVNIFYPKQRPQPHGGPSTPVLCLCSPIPEQQPPPCNRTMQAVAPPSAPAIFSSANGLPHRSAAPSITFPTTGRPRRGAVRCELTSSSAPSAVGPITTRWAQKTVVISPQSRGCHLITSKVTPALSSLQL
jgi:hypothetical protein